MGVTMEILYKRGEVRKSRLHSFLWETKVLMLRFLFTVTAAAFKMLYYDNTLGPRGRRTRNGFKKTTVVKE